MDPKGGCFQKRSYDDAEKKTTNEPTGFGPFHLFMGQGSKAAVCHLAEWSEGEQGSIDGF